MLPCEASVCLPVSCAAIWCISCFTHCSQAHLRCLLPYCLNVFFFFLSCCMLSFCRCVVPLLDSDWHLCVWLATLSGIQEQGSAPMWGIEIHDVLVVCRCAQALTNAVHRMAHDPSSFALHIMTDAFGEKCALPYCGQTCSAAK
jgi:hypothetical protein